MSNKVENKATKEVLYSKDLKPLIDQNKIDEFKKSMGYYQIIFSELELSETEIIDKYHGFTRIEDQLRVMKSTLETRPIFVRNPEHVNAHLLTCFVALVTMRIIQNKILKSENISAQNCWTYGLSANKICAALNKFKVDKFPKNFLRFNDIDNPNLQCILKAFGINISLNLFRDPEITRLKSNISVF